MKYLLPLFYVFFNWFTLSSQTEALQVLDFIPANSSEFGTADISGNIDETARVLNLVINYADLGGSLASAHIHGGTVTAPGPVILNLGVFGDEVASSGQLDRRIEFEEESFTKNTSKTFRVLQTNEFDNIADAINKGEVCVSLQVENIDMSFRTVQSVLLLKAADAPLVPTMSQWALILLGMILSSISLIYLKQQQMAKG